MPALSGRVSSLIRKGYLRKVPSEEDHREYQVMERIARRFTPEECGRQEDMPEIVTTS